MSELCPGFVAAVLVAAPCSVVFPAAPAGEGDRLTVEDVVGLRRVTTVEIGPNGQRAAYVLSVSRDADDAPGPPYAEIWVAALDGSPPRRFTRESGRASSPRWSPDGSRIAFIDRGPDADEDASTEIHVMPVDGGAASVLVAHETSVGELRWSPDGSRIAFLAEDARSENERDAEEAGRDWVVLDEDRPYQRLWIADVATGETFPMYDEALHATDFAWAPGGETIIAVAADSPSTDHNMMYSRLYRMAAPTAEAGATAPAVAVPEVIVDTVGKLGPLAVSPDGARLAFLGAVSLNDPLPQSLFVTPMDGSEPRNLSAGAERSAEFVAWLGDRTGLELASKGTHTMISLFDVDAGASTVLVWADHAVSAISAHPTTGRFVAVARGPDHPGELFVGAIDPARFERLTDHNPLLASRRLGRVETIRWTARDGRVINGVLTHPVTDDPGPHPLVVNPHGGPEGVSRQAFDELPQLLAARGHLVLQPNYRGSGGHGVAFSKGDHDDLGGAEFEDILAGVDELIRRGLADPERVGMGGWSYGGYLSAMAATHHSARFKAAVMGAGISNWVSFTGTTDIPDEMSIVHWNRPMEENVDLYWERSPLSAIDGARTPTLILFGADDERVPPSQGRELYRALRDKGIDTEMVLYPRAGHGIRERAHRIDLFERQLAWFERYLK